MSKLVNLLIKPLDDQYARLMRVIGNIDPNSIFAQLCNYDGFSYYQTQEDVTIDYAQFNDKKYSISQINVSAFSNCRDIKIIRIGASVSLIQWNVYQCSSLLNIFVDPANKVFHDIDGVLFKGSELIAFPQGRIGHYEVPYGTTKIGNHAFKSCSLSSISFPETLKEIGNNSFYECHNIQEFILPKSIQKVSSNNDIGNKPISQTFYLSKDVEKSNPLYIWQVTKLFPE